jgi:hypothetical protein
MKKSLMIYAFTLKRLKTYLINFEVEKNEFISESLMNVKLDILSAEIKEIGPTSS